MPSNYLILCRPLLLPPSIFPSIRVFSNESALCIRWPKCWSLSFNTSPSSEYSELISFRMDWFDLLAVQGTLKSLLQHHSSEASLLRCSVISHRALWSIHACVLSSFSPVRLFATPWTVARRAPLSVGFSRQERWNGLPCTPLGEIPESETGPASLISPALAGRFFIATPSGKSPGSR